MESLGVFRRDLLTDLSYKLSFALQALRILLGIAAYYFLACLLGESTPGGYAPFPFFLVGMAVNGYMTTALVCFTQAVKGHQVTGTLKSVLATRTSPVPQPNRQELTGVQTKYSRWMAGPSPPAASCPSGLDWSLIPAQTVRKGPRC